MSLLSPRKREFVRVVSEMDLEVCVMYVFSSKILYTALSTTNNSLPLLHLLLIILFHCCSLFDQLAFVNRYYVCVCVCVCVYVCVYIHIVSCVG